MIDTPQNRAAMPNADFTQWVRPKPFADFFRESPPGIGRIARRSTARGGRCRYMQSQSCITFSIPSRTHSLVQGARLPGDEIHEGRMIGQ
jgi:hypothetical protein